jgi:4-amino-4-deoxychorismate lyase
MAEFEQANPTTSVPILGSNEWFDRIRNPLQVNPFWKDYFAMYSSWVGGIVTNPAFFMLPIDDHVVHRGDGVFEAITLVSNRVYLFEEHLDRLFISAESVGMKKKWSREEIKTIVLQTIAAVTGLENCLIRLYLTRGPGEFSPNPYDSIDPQLYVVLTHLKHPSPEKYNQGIRVGISSIPPKQPWMSRIKSCNYLPNVLMKREAVDNGYDFVVAISETGYITESATENIMMLDCNGILVHPRLDGILKGTTMIRVCQLAQEHGFAMEIRDFTVEDLKQAREVMMVGTTLNVISIVEFDKTPIADGKPGEIARRLHEFILADQLTYGN